jgi:hypothetical protein
VIIIAEYNEWAECDRNDQSIDNKNYRRRNQKRVLIGTHLFTSDIIFCYSYIPQYREFKVEI